MAEPPPVPPETAAKKKILDSIAKKQYARGYSDGKVGHSPSHLRGAYMEGYIAGRSDREP